MFKFEIGMTARDRVTGFEGVIVARSEHITYCNTYGLQAPAKDGKVDNPQWFDEPRLEQLEVTRVSLPNAYTGPGPNPQRTR